MIENQSSTPAEVEPLRPPADTGTISRGSILDECPTFCLKNAIWVGFFLLLTLATRCANWRDIIVPAHDGAPRQIFFAQGEGDCYSRMTRVRQVLEGWGVVHYHAFENSPQGVFPHTTAPFDFLIAGIALLLKPFMTDYIDMAGAIVSPLLGVLTTAFLALWSRELQQCYRRSMLLLVSLSPILVHGFELGRPRHTSLEIFLLAVGIGAELIMARRVCKNWAIFSGIAWGFALWVSLYEPLALIVVIYVTKLIFYRSNLFVKERLWGLSIFAGILAVAYFVDGRYVMKSLAIEAHDPALRNYFGSWSSTIEELKGLKEKGQNIFSQLLFRWVGFGLLVAPLLLIARLRDAKRTILVLALLVATFAFTLEEERWGYFFALVYAMSLPWQFSLFRRKWVVWTLFLISLWPVAQQWDYWLFDPAHDEMSAAQLNEQQWLRQAAEVIKEKAPGCILAPWWWSPQLAYWSRQPAVAGASHESLSGIVDTSRFFSTANPKLAEDICTNRKVETVVTGNPGPIVDESVEILGQPEPLQENTMADILWMKPHSAPLFLHLIYDNNVMKVFEVNHGSVVR